MNTAYILDENEELNSSIKQYMELSGFEVQSFCDIKGAQSAIARTSPDILILDLLFPDGDGFSFIKKLRSTNQEFPVVITTAKASESDKIMGFELGADDYLVKPYSPKELVLRCKSILKRVQSIESKGKPQRWVSSDGSVLQMDRDSHLFLLNSQPLGLTAAEWRILTYLSQNEGILISRDQVLEHCFDYSSESYDRIVDTHIKNIRTKTGKCWIETVRGYGYRFTGSSSINKEA